MKNACLYLILISIALTGCSASKKALKEAEKLADAGLYVEAAEQDLKALREKPGFKEALVHLRKVGPEAYYELIKRAATHEAAENWDLAVKEYKHMDSLLRKFSRHGVVFETVNIRERLSLAKQKAAAYHYAKAEDYFKNRRWQNAAFAYLKAHDHIANYNRSFNKAIQSFLNSGNQRLAATKFKKALDAFHRILELAPGHRKAEQKIAEVHYLLGKQFYHADRFREALEQFEFAREFVTNFRDAALWEKRAYENAVQYVGIFPFLNQTQVSIDGYFIASEIEHYVNQADLEFLDLLPNTEIIGLVRELRTSRYFSVSESELLSAAKKEEMNSIVWGKIRDVYIKDEPESFTEYEHKKTTTVKDTSGNDVEKTESIFYREYKKSRRVKIELQTMILDTKTGKYLDEHRYREELTDEARWIAYQGSINDLPKKKRKLLDAPRNLRPEYVMIDALLQKIAEKISREVIRFYE
ncbi:MAG: hypothetical protein E2O76_05895 [Caldithrix sp.]|nr:MAG: hypothetical protein E2O76_05895 [Caldithrix sp.]